MRTMFSSEFQGFAEASIVAAVNKRNLLAPFNTVPGRTVRSQTKSPGHKQNHQANCN
jgi:hypothetical protein